MLYHACAQQVMHIQCADQFILGVDGGQGVDPGAVHYLQYFGGQHAGVDGVAIGGHDILNKCVVSGGTDNHLMLLDLRSLDEELTGKEAAVVLDGVGITLNRNSIPNDPRPPFVTSGLRIGTPSVTTAGMREGEMERLGSLILETIAKRGDEAALKEVADGVSELVAAFPPYPADFPGHV